MFQVEFWDFDCKSKSKRSAENLKNVSQTSPPLHLIFENFDFYGIDFFFLVWTGFLQSTQAVKL